MTVVYDARWTGDHGIGRHAREVEKRLPVSVERLTSGPPPVRPTEPLWLSGHLRRNRPEVFVTPMFNLPVLSPRGTRCIPTIHDLVHLQFPEDFGRLKVGYFRYHVLPVLARCGRVLTVSRASADQLCDLARLTPERVSVVGNGVSDSFRWTQKSAARRPTVLAFASPKVHKGLSVLAEALHHPAVAQTEPLLRVVGARAFEGEARPLLEASGVDVHWVGMPNDPDLAKEYARAHVFVTASLAEGFGLPPIEAVATGTTVVATDIPAHREMLGDLATVTLAEAGSPEALAVALGIALSEPRDAAALRASSETIVKRHDWADTAGSLMAAVQGGDPDEGLGGANAHP